MRLLAIVRTSIYQRHLEIATEVRPKGPPAILSLAAKACISLRDRPVVYACGRLGGIACSEGVVYHRGDGMVRSLAITG